MTKVNLAGTVGLCFMGESQAQGHLISCPKPPQDPEALRSPSGKEGALPGTIVRALPFKCFLGVPATMRAANTVGKQGVAH